MSFQSTKYTLNIKVVAPPEIKDTVATYYSKFVNHHNGDSGIDLMTIDSIISEPFDVETLDFNIQCEMINNNNEFVSYYLYPRSSISKTAFQMANSVGIIDAGYRGNIMAKVRNCRNEKSELVNTLSYFQICSHDLKPIKVNVVEELSTTTRNAGFGSTN